jgi:hypothetical protein
MKLKEFNLTNIRSESDRRRRQATVSVNGKSGLIGFSSSAVRAMELKAGQRVVFFQDEESKVDWFVRRSEDVEAIALRGKNGSGMLFFNGSVLANSILDATQGRERYVFCVFPVQEKAMKIEGENGFHMIITVKPVRARVE